MKVSKKGIEQLIKFEGSRKHAYQDVAGFWTIGVGHLLTRSELTSGKLFIDGKSIDWRNGLTEKQIKNLLKQDVSVFEDDVSEHVKTWMLPKLTQQHFDVLVSFVFNVGLSAFKHSTLLRVLNQGKVSEVPKQLQRWVYAGGKKRRGLIRRRKHEAELWERAA